MKSVANDRFWSVYASLDSEVKKAAKKQYKLFKTDYKHPSLKFKCINNQNSIYSVRITKSIRAVGILNGNIIIWFWIGNHDDYERFFG